LLESNTIASLVTVALTVTIWEGVIVVFHMRSYVLPSPVAVGHALFHDRIFLLRQTWITLLEVIGGFGLAVGVGIPIAIGIAFSAPLRKLFYPLLVTSQSMPIIAIAPVLLAWFGFGYMPKVLIAAIIAVFPIIINTVVGLHGIDPEMLLMARSTGGRPLRILAKVRIPAALPSVFAGLKMGITLSVIGAVVGEFVSGTSGLGYAVQLAQGELRMDLSFAAIVILAVIGVVLFYAVEFAERKLIPWHPSQRQRELEAARAVQRTEGALATWETNDDPGEREREKSLAPLSMSREGGPDR